MNFLTEDLCKLSAFTSDLPSLTETSVSVVGSTFLCLKVEDWVLIKKEVMWS